MMIPHPEMTAQDVFDLLQLCAEHDLEIILDGGWGVDALLGEQTRSHADVDIAMPHSDALHLRVLLEARGFQNVPRDDTRDCNFVLGDDRGRLVDFHTYSFDAEGNLTFGVPYPLESLRGEGVIAGQPVRCITPEWMVEFHTGYPLDENDYHDVKLLCQRFGIAIPEAYAAFVQTEGADL